MINLGGRGRGENYEIENVTIKHVYGDCLVWWHRGAFITENDFGRAQTKAFERDGGEWDSLGESSSVSLVLSSF